MYEYTNVHIQPIPILNVPRQRLIRHEQQQGSATMSASPHIEAVVPCNLPCRMCFVYACMQYAY